MRNARDINVARDMDGIYRRETRSRDCTTAESATLKRAGFNRFIFVRFINENSPAAWSDRA